MGRRTVLLIVAIIVALLGVSLVLLYVNGIDNRAREGQETVEVLYSKSAIALGTTGDAAQKAGAFESRKIPRDAVAEGALSSVEPVANLQAINAIASGQPITTFQWGEAGTGSSIPIPSNKLALSLQLGDPQRVAGFVSPGSEVAVFVTRTPTNGNEPVTTLLLARVPVIAVGPTTVTKSSSSDGSTTNTEEVPNAIITLALDQKQAEKVIVGQTVGELYFGLLTKQSKTGGNARTTPSNLG